MSARYPAIEPYRKGTLRVGRVHTLAFSESGNPRGKPVVCLHGGPGAGSDPDERRLFDPGRYRIIQVDQRGCGESTPLASVEENTTWDLVADLEVLRTELGLEQWQLLGGSWGSTLALAYAETHPTRVTGLVLRGVFLVRKQELDWFYRAGAHQLFPDAFAELVEPVPPDERHDLLEAYGRLLASSDPDVRLQAARAWSRWEARTCTLVPDCAFVALLEDPSRSLALATLENHYFRHGAWLEGRELLANVAPIRHLPCIIVQGRYDVVCPLRSAWELHRAWPESELHVVEGAGHASHEPAIARALVRATDALARR